MTEDLRENWADVEYENMMIEDRFMWVLYMLKLLSEEGFGVHK